MNDLSTWLDSSLASNPLLASAVGNTPNRLRDTEAGA